MISMHFPGAAGPSMAPYRRQCRRGSGFTTAPRYAHLTFVNGALCGKAGADALKSLFGLIRAAADLLFISAGAATVLYAVEPDVRRWAEINLLTSSAYYYLGEVSENGLGDRLSFKQFYSARWDEEGAPRVLDADEAPTIWQTVRALKGGLVFAYPEAQGEPIPGRTGPGPNESPITIARPGVCYHVRDVVCRIGGQKQGARALEIDPGCEKVEETLETFESVDFGAVWIAASSVTCS